MFSILGLIIFLILLVKVIFVVYFDVINGVWEFSEYEGKDYNEFGVKIVDILFFNMIDLVD